MLVGRNGEKQRLAGKRKPNSILTTDRLPHRLKNGNSRGDPFFNYCSCYSTGMGASRRRKGRQDSRSAQLKGHFSMLMFFYNLIDTKPRRLLPVGPAYLAHARRILNHKSFAEDDADEEAKAGFSGEDGNGGPIEDDLGVGEEEENADLLLLDPKDWKVCTCCYNRPRSNRSIESRSLPRPWVIEIENQSHPGSDSGCSYVPYPALKLPYSTD